MTSWKWIGLAFGAIALAVAALLVYGTLRWSGLTRELTARLEAARVQPQPAQFDARELEGLPAPVQRFFRTALSDGAPVIATVSVTHRGTFNMSESGEQWKPFTSTQRVITRRPGFVWDGRVALLPGLAVHVHDAYIAGEGILHPAIVGLFTLMDLRGHGDVAQGELMRYFAEAACYPTALLPSQGLRWEAVDERSARATLTDGPLSLTLLFIFNDAGLIESVRADARGRTVGGSVVMTPWEGRWSDYQERDGMRLPMTGEVAGYCPSVANLTGAARSSSCATSLRSESNPGLCWGRPDVKIARQYGAETMPLPCSTSWQAFDMYA